MTRDELLPLLEEILVDHPELVSSMVSDLIAINERDPACHSLTQPLLYYKGFPRASDLSPGTSNVEK
jgi:serine O-acetyltransferase